MSGTLRALALLALLATQGCFTWSSYDHFTKPTYRTVGKIPAVARGEVTGIERISIAVETSGVWVHVLVACDDGKKRHFVAGRQRPSFQVSDAADLPSSSVPVHVVADSGSLSWECTYAVADDGTIGTIESRVAPAQERQDALVHFVRADPSAWSFQVSLPQGVPGADEKVPLRLVLPTPRSLPERDERVEETNVAGAIAFALLCPVTVVLDVATLPFALPIILFLGTALASSTAHY